MNRALRACLLLFLLGCAAAEETGRDDVFVGYKETGVQGDDGSGGDGGSNGGLADATDARSAGDGGGAGAAQDSAAASQEAGAVDDLSEAATQAGRIVTLHTQFGPIRVTLLETLAPLTTALVWELAQARGCRSCSFYRQASCSSVCKLVCCLCSKPMRVPAGTRHDRGQAKARRMPCFKAAWI